MHDETDRDRGPLRRVAERVAEGGASAFVGMFNHLLRQNDWARARLAAFAGRSVSVELQARSLTNRASSPLAARITDEGLLDARTGQHVAGTTADVAGTAADEQRAGLPRFDAEVHVRPSFAAAGALLRERTRGLAPYLRIEGEATLAAALLEVAERMRWDPEEDLSRITGDVVAHRIGRGVGAARDAMRELRTRVAGAAGRRFASASGTLVAREELVALRTSIDELESRLACVESKRRRRRAGRGEAAGADADGHGSAEAGAAVDRSVPALLRPPRPGTDDPVD